MIIEWVYWAVEASLFQLKSFVFLKIEHNFENFVALKLLLPQLSMFSSAYVPIKSFGLF